MHTTIMAVFWFERFRVRSTCFTVGRMLRIGLSSMNTIRVLSKGSLGYFRLMLPSERHSVSAAADVTCTTKEPIQVAHHLLEPRKPSLIKAVTLLLCSSVT